MQDNALLLNTSDRQLLKATGRCLEEADTVPAHDWRLICWQVGVCYHLRFGERPTMGRWVKNMLQSGRKKYMESRKEKFWALQDICFALKSGDMMGLIGHNGAGKSTLIRVLSGIEEPDAGTMYHNGKVGSLMSLTAGFKLNLSGYENVFLKGALLGLSTEKINALMPEIIDFCQIGDFFYAPMKSYSAGMRGRVGFAVAAHMMTDIIVLDEVFGAGDEKFRQKAGNIFDHIRQGNDRVLVLATHNLGMLENICTHVLWLDKGRQRAFGPAKEVIRAYRAEALRN